MLGALAWALIWLAGATPLDLDCGQRDAAVTLIGRARLSEIEWAEDVNREAMWQAFGGCSGQPGAEACRERERLRFTADLDAALAAIDDKYRRIFEDFEARCRASIT